MRTSFAGDRPLTGFLVQTYSKSAGATEGMFPALTPLPRQITVKLTSRKGTAREFKLDVPSVEKRRDYLDTFYVILQKDNTPAAKLTLHPRPLNEMVKLTERESRFAYTLLPDDVNPKYGQYRDLCRATFEGDLRKVQRLIASGAAVEWPDPHSPSVLLCAQEQPQMVELLLHGDAGRYSMWVVSRMAGIYLRKNDRATADHLAKVLMKTHPSREWGGALLGSAVDSGTDGPVRYVIEDLHIDPNTTLANPGQGALYFAVMNGNLAAAKYLLTKTKADPNLGLPKFSTLDRALEAQHAKAAHGAEMVKLLLEHGARKSPQGPNID